MLWVSLILEDGTGRFSRNVGNKQPKVLHKIPEEWRCHLRTSRSLKSCTDQLNFNSLQTFIIACNFSVCILGWWWHLLIFWETWEFPSLTHSSQSFHFDMNSSPGCWPDFVFKYLTLQSSWNPMSCSIYNSGPPTSEVFYAVIGGCVTSRQAALFWSLLFGPILSFLFEGSLLVRWMRSERKPT